MPTLTSDQRLWEQSQYSLPELTALRWVSRAGGWVGWATPSISVPAAVKMVDRLMQIEREPLKRSASSRSGPAGSSSGVAARRPSVHAVGDVLACRGLVSVSPPPTAPRPSPASSEGVVALPRCLERLLSIDSVGVRSAMDRSLVKVHLANGCFNVFKCSDSTTVKVLHLSF